jgi:hypothetical protein
MLRRYGRFTDRTSAAFPVADPEQQRAIIRMLQAG